MKKKDVLKKSEQGTYTKCRGCHLEGYEEEVVVLV
jgi:hypothetical protein